MTHIEQAIREAVEKGSYQEEILTGGGKYTRSWSYQLASPAYRTGYFQVWGEGQYTCMLQLSDADIFLDPLFWQALGKARGWEDHRCEQCNDVFPEYHNGCVRCGKSVRPDPFNRYHWHRFIDHRAEGKDAESFFRDL